MSLQDPALIEFEACDELYEQLVAEQEPQIQEVVQRTVLSYFRDHLRAALDLDDSWESGVYRCMFVSPKDYAVGRAAVALNLFCRRKISNVEKALEDKIHEKFAAIRDEVNEYLRAACELLLSCALDDAGLGICNAHCPPGYASGSFEADYLQCDLRLIVSFSLTWQRVLQLIQSTYNIQQPMILAVYGSLQPNYGSNVKMLGSYCDLGHYSIKNFTNVVDPEFITEHGYKAVWHQGSELGVELVVVDSSVISAIDKYEAPQFKRVGPVQVPRLSNCPLPVYLYCHSDQLPPGHMRLQTESGDAVSNLLEADEAKKRKKSPAGVFKDVFGLRPYVNKQNSKAEPQDQFVSLVWHHHETFDMDINLPEQGLNPTDHMEKFEADIRLLDPNLRVMWLPYEGSGYCRVLIFKDYLWDVASKRYKVAAKKWSKITAATAAQRRLAQQVADHLNQIFGTNENDGFRIGFLSDHGASVYAADDLIMITDSSSNSIKFHHSLQKNNTASLFACFTISDFMQLLYSADHNLPMKFLQQMAGTVLEQKMLEDVKQKGEQP